MIIYISMILIVSFFSILAYFSTDNVKRKLIYIFIFLILSLVMGLRYGIGTDYFYTYKPVFEIVLITGDYNNIESGFVLFIKIIQLFTKDYAWLFLITSFIFNYFTFKSILNQSKNKTLSLFLMVCGCFYFYAMNVIRQSIVISIFIFSLKFIKDKKFYKYLLFILLASCFHKIAFLFIPVYFFCNMKINKKNLIILSVGIFIFTQTIISLLVKFLAGTKYGNYISGYYSISENNNMISPLINFILFLGYVIFEKESEGDNYTYIYKNIHLLGVWTSMFLGTIPLISRVFVNFYQIQFLSIPYLIDKFKVKNTKIIIALLCVIAFSINFFYSIGIKNGNNVLPYRWIFER